MSNCDLCGREAGLAGAIVEGSLLQVCKACTTYGNVVKIPSIKHKAKEKIKTIMKEQEDVSLIVGDYAQRIKQTREQLKLTQEDLAKKLNEKESFLHKIEQGKQEPPLALAKKIEHILHIHLIEDYQEQGMKPAALANEGLTIGDLIRLRKNK